MVRCARRIFNGYIQVSHYFLTDIYITYTFQCAIFKGVTSCLVREWSCLTCQQLQVTFSAAYWCLTLALLQIVRSLKNAPGGVVIKVEEALIILHGACSVEMSCGPTYAKML